MTIVKVQIERTGNEEPGGDRTDPLQALSRE